MPRRFLLLALPIAVFVSHAALAAPTQAARDDDGAGTQFVGVGALGSGQLVATYDHAVWWDQPTAEVTCLLWGVITPVPLDAGLQAVPCGQSDELQLRDATPLLWPASVPSLGEALRQRGHVLLRSPLDGVAYVLTGNAGLHREENGMSNFAWDLVKANKDRSTLRANAVGDKIEDYLVTDELVRLPTSGTLFEVVDGIADNLPCNGREPDGGCVNEKQPDGNKVGVRLGDTDFYVYFLHLKCGSVMRSQPVPCKDAARNPVCKTGDDCARKFGQLGVATPLGHVGNSGLSVQPHLHVGLLWYDSVTSRSWSVPVEFQNLFVRHGSFDVAPVQYPYARPTVKSWISNTPF
jgi:hypothetical protein